MTIPHIKQLCLIILLTFSSLSLADIVVSEAKARATFALAKTGAAYFTITNQGSEPVTLTHASVAESIASMVEIHNVVMYESMMRMQELEDGLSLAPGESVSLAPGGKHIMLVGLTGPLNEGDSFELTLHFNQAESQTILVPIIKM